MVTSESQCVVRLTGDEYLIALHAGCVRRANAYEKGRTHRYKADPRFNEQMDMSGAVGEACVAKFLNVFWMGGDLGSRDVGLAAGGCEVRTKGDRNHRLILHPADHDDVPYVSVCVKDGAALICGWLFGKEGKQEKYWSEPVPGRPAYFVPNSDLRPAATLKDWHAKLCNQTIDSFQKIG